MKQERRKKEKGGMWGRKKEGVRFNLPHIISCVWEGWGGSGMRVNLNLITVNSRKYAPPPFFHTTLTRGKSGEWAFAQILISSRTWWLPMNGSFDERVLQKISGACVKTKPRGIAATCIISASRGQPHVSLRFQCEQQKPWWWPANNAVVLLYVVYKHYWRQS